MHLLNQKLHYLKVYFYDLYIFFFIKNYFLAIIHHQIDHNKRSADNYLFKYILEHASTYNIQIKKRNFVRYFFFV